MEAGSQLIALFEGGKDAATVLAMVQALVSASLGSKSAATVEAARGSVIVYITFIAAGPQQAGNLVDDLRQKGAKVFFSHDGQSDFMKVVGRGVHTFST